jgi:nicotinamidase-related amidase
MTSETKHTVLLVMDVQSGVTDRLENPDKYIGEVAKAVAAAHKNHLPVFYVVVGFRNGFPEVSPNNKSFSAIKDTMATSFVASRPALKITRNDIIIMKHRVSSFSGSDLEMLLRAQDLRHLVLAGVATSGVVLSTVREAADKDFRLTVLSDLCKDFDDEVQSVLIEKVFPRQARVITSQQWITLIK